MGLDSYTERRGRVDAFLFFLSLPRGWGTVPKTRGVELVVVVVFDDGLGGLCALVLDVAGRLGVGRGGGTRGLALSLLGFAPLAGLAALARFAGFT